MLLEYEVIEYTPLHDRGRLKGFISVRVHPCGLVFKSLRHLILDNGEEVIRTPSKFTNDDNVTVKIINFDSREEWIRFTNEILKQLHEKDHLNGKKRSTREGVRIPSGLQI